MSVAVLQRERAVELRYTYVKFAVHFAPLFAHQAQMLSQLEDLLYTREGSKQAMLDLVIRCGFENDEHLSLEDEHCLLDAIVYQLNQLWKVTDPDELRQEAVTYIENCPLLADGTPLQSFVQDEEWIKYLEEMRDNHFCDHLMLVALATVLRRTIVLYSGAEPNLEAIHIIPDNVNDRLQPIHVGHASRLTFVTLRRNSGIQAQDDDLETLSDDNDSIIQEDEDEEDDVTDTESPNTVEFQRTPAGEISRWNVRKVSLFFRTCQIVCGL